MAIGPTIGVQQDPQTTWSGEAGGAHGSRAEEDDIWKTVPWGCGRRGAQLPQREQAVRCGAGAARVDGHICGDDGDAGANASFGKSFVTCADTILR
jgi:hypothetical protein